MSLKNLFKIFIFLSSLTIKTNAEIPRIGSLSFNKSSVQTIYIAEGRSTIIIFPCQIFTFSPGPTKDIAVNLNEKDNKQIEVWLGKDEKQPATLKVRCKEDNFAIDIIPTKNLHQDFVEISKAYGKPHSLNSIREINLNLEMGSAQTKKEKEENLKIGQKKPEISSKGKE